MGFLKRFFSFGGKKGKKHAEKLQSRPYDPEATLHPSSADPEAAVSRLLRSSSAHFNVVSEMDYMTLPPIPHPINTISRSTNTLSPSRSASIQTKNSYSVKVHKREQLSRTEFPNANPPLRDSLCTPRRFDYKSTPNLHESHEPARRRQISDPRKIPFTPRDQNRLNRLRQDPSVVSLLNMYDDKGQLDDNAFSNTPPPLPSALAKRCRRESTFKDLLGGGGEEEGVFEGDLSWAERCIAESNASTSSLSTIQSPALETPTMPVFETDNERNVDKTFSSESSGNYPTISSLEVELSIVVDEDEEDVSDKNEADITLAAEPKSPNRVQRTPSHRASQVFNFLSEKRERRKSQGPENLLSSNTNEHQLQAAPHYETSADIRHTVVSKFDIPEILIDEYSTVELSVNPLSADHLTALALPAPAPPSPLVFHPLNPAPRAKSRSTGAAEVLGASRYNGTDEASRQSRRPARGSTGAGVLLYNERERERQKLHEREKEVLVRGPRPLPQAPALQGSKHRSERRPSTKDRDARPAFGEITNGSSVTGIQDLDAFTALPKRSSIRSSSLSKGFTNVDPSVSAVKNISHPKRLGAPMWKENVRTGSASQIDLGRSATTSRFMNDRPTLSGAPMTPARSRSLFEAPSPTSSSELSPEAKQLMADLRTRKLRARQMQREQEKRPTRAHH